MQVHVLPSLAVVGRFGGRGNKQERFDFSTAGGMLCFSPQGNLLVAEGDGQRVQAIKLGYDAEKRRLTAVWQVCRAVQPPKSWGQVSSL